MSVIGNIPTDKVLTTNDIADGAITTVDLADNSVTPAKITTAARANGVVYENEQTITSDYTLVATRNGISAGPVTIANGITVTINNGANWIIC